MVIQIDTREKAKAIRSIEDEFEKQNIQHFSSKLYVGDYMSLDNPRLCIDRKQNLNELCSNVSSVPKKGKDGRIRRDKEGKVMTDLARFSAELDRAQKNGIKIIILCEHGKGMRTLDDVKNWNNPRLRTSPLAMSGKRLHQILLTLSKTYNFDIVFCDKRNTGKEIIRILGGNTSE